MYDLQRTSRRQHHAIVHALQNGEGAGVAALMYEHAYETKASINLASNTWRSGLEDEEVSCLEKGADWESRRGNREERLR